MKPGRRVAVVGGGWAGLAAAVEAVRLGHQVTLYEMAPQLGGRAREVEFDDLTLDNGQHILIGAYTETLALMRRVGVDPDRVLARSPLRIMYPDGQGLNLSRGPAAMAFTWAVLGRRGWRWRDKLSLLRAASAWTANRFQCNPSWTVERLTADLPETVRNELLDPLCVAALNTPSSQASAAMFLRVLHDALLSGPGSADLLLPRERLSALWPQPAAKWLAQAGAAIHVTQRVNTLQPLPNGWRVEGQVFDTAVLACSAVEAARLTETAAPGWSREARALGYEPIITVYAQSRGSRLPLPMLALHTTADAPAQFVFDLGTLCNQAGLLAFVISGAAQWVAKGSDATTAAVLAQAEQALAGHLASPLVALYSVTEKRATFLCTPQMHRPALRILPGLLAAGDYVDGPYPATLEGAIRSGLAAATSIA